MQARANWQYKFPELPEDVTEKLRLEAMRLLLGIHKEENSMRRVHEILRAHLDIPWELRPQPHMDWYTFKGEFTPQTAMGRFAIPEVDATDAIERMLNSFPRFMRNPENQEVTIENMVRTFQRNYQTAERHFRQYGREVATEREKLQDIQNYVAARNAQLPPALQYEFNPNHNQDDLEVLLYPHTGEDEIDLLSEHLLRDQTNMAP